jgi:ring-1,2-phenylacetyl-CoA epoxidase subunit PaaC
VSRTALDSAVARYCLALGDDALVLAQRLCEWAASSPAIEEDVASMNIALDLIGQARSFLSYAAEREGAGRTEDDLAYLRDERDFSNAQIVELPNGDFATTMARQLLFSAYQYELYEVLSGSADAPIAAISAKAFKEVSYHRDHAATWVVRLGDGTDESHDRMTAGLDVVWPFAGELFEPFDSDSEPFDSDSGPFGPAGFVGLGGPAGLARLVEARIACDPASLHEPWLRYVTSVLTEATLQVPSTTWAPAGGRRGLHTEGFGYLLAEMQHLHRSFPGATW